MSTLRTKQRKFYNSVEKGNCKDIRAYLALGLDIHADKGRALYLAALHGRADAAALLLAHGADVHADHDHALETAATYNRADVVALLLAHGADMYAKEGSALYMAAHQGRTAIMAIFLKHDKGLATSEYMDVLLPAAVKRNHVETAALLLDHGANIHMNQNQPLHVAVENYAIEATALLLERGADIHADNDEALAIAIKNGQVEMTALLLERGAKIQEANPDNGYNKRIMALLKAYEFLETQARHFGNSGPVRSLVYQAAAMGVVHGIEGHALIDMVQNIVRRSLEDTEYARLDVTSDRAFDPAQLVLLEHRAQNQPKMMAAKLGIRGYLETGEVRDMVSEYADAILLPRLLLDAKLNETQIAQMSEEEVGALSKKLMPLAARDLFFNKRLDEIRAMSKEWHINGNAIPPDLRPRLPDQWQKLVEEVDTPFEYEGHKLVIRALENKQQLVNESAALNHCVGRGSNYIQQCANGNSHILSVQTKEGMPLATREVTLADDSGDPFQEEQFSSGGNCNPPAIARQVMDWFDNRLKKGIISLNEPHHGRWGTLPEVSSQPPAIQRIGYKPGETAIGQCLEHYEKHLLIKQPFMHKARREGAFYQPPTLMEDYHWVQSIRANALPARGEEWNALVENIRSAAGLPAKETAKTIC